MKGYCTMPCETSLDPYAVNQVFVATVGYGHVARCGCGWRAVHNSAATAVESGRRHVTDKHAFGSRSALFGDNEARREL